MINWVIADEFTGFLKDDEGVFQAGEGLDGFLDELNAVENHPGVSTGYPRLDKAMGRLRRKSVDVIAGRTGIGKSFFAMNVGLNVASKGIPILLVDTHMSRELHHLRMLSAISKVPTIDIESGRFADDADQERRVNEAIDYVESLPWTYKRPLDETFEKVLLGIQKWVKQTVGVDENGVTNDCLLIYDDLTAFSADKQNLGNTPEHEIYRSQMGRLRKLTADLDIPCLLIAQSYSENFDDECADVIIEEADNVFLYKEND